MTQPPSTLTSPRHLPVMLAEVLAALAPASGEIYIDATFGAGGYSRAILEAALARVLALDRDIRAVRAAAPLCAEFPGRLTVVEAPFSTLAEVAGVYETPNGQPKLTTGFIDGIVLDIGVSSMQIDEPERGFSFQSDGPLDMRMAAHGQTVADIVNTLDEEPLANILYDLGEEKRSRAIARAIVRQRETAPFKTTLELARLVSRVLGGRRDDGRHPATRSFQALRIHVNDELGELRAALTAAEQILKPGGRLVVVTFHSLEDRIVKQFFAERIGRSSGQGSRHLPPATGSALAPSFRIINQRALRPHQPELDANPRARSAKLRAGIRI